MSWRWFVRGGRCIDPRARRRRPSGPAPLFYARVSPRARALHSGTGLDITLSGGTVALTGTPLGLDPVDWIDESSRRKWRPWPCSRPTRAARTSTPSPTPSTTPAGAWCSTAWTPTGDPADEREAILGIDCGDDVDGVTHFQRLDLHGLAALLGWRLIEPDARQNRAPSTLECLTFLGRWPEVRVHGYALHRDREGDGGRVSIEGFECDIEEVEEDLRAPLREAFRRWAHADEFVDDGEHLYARWD